MGKYRAPMWICAFCSVHLCLPISAKAQAAPAVQQIATDDGKQAMIPTRVVEFKAVESDPNFKLPSMTVESPHCLSDGSLVLRSIDWETVNKTPKGKFPKYNEIVNIVQSKKVRTILATSISDLTDFQSKDVFPGDSGIYFLLDGTKEQPGERGPGASPTGIPLNDYHNLVARFDLDGTYKGTTELGTGCDLSRSDSCQLRHLAVFPSGDMLVSESDPETSTLKVLYLKSSGEVVKQIDVPASRKIMAWGLQYSTPADARQAPVFLSSVQFTAVGNNILVWHANSDDPVVEVTQGGGAREVPIQIPKGWRFADMVASNDRWVAHFRTEDSPTEGQLSEDTDAYFEFLPQDGSLAAKLVQKGDVPLKIACESSGSYTSFKMSDAGKMVLLKGE